MHPQSLQITVCFTCVGSRVDADKASPASQWGPCRQPTETAQIPFLITRCVDHQDLSKGAGRKLGPRRERYFQPGRRKPLSTFMTNCLRADESSGEQPALPHGSRHSTPRRLSWEAVFSSPMIKDAFLVYQIGQRRKAWRHPARGHGSSLGSPWGPDRGGGPAAANLLGDSPPFGVRRRFF